MLLTNPSTLVSTVASPGNVCSTSRKSESPPSSKNTSHVVGDSSVTRPSSLNTTHTSFISFNSKQCISKEYIYTRYRQLSKMVHTPIQWWLLPRMQGCTSMRFCQKLYYFYHHNNLLCSYNNFELQLYSTV